MSTPSQDAGYKIVDRSGSTTQSDDRLGISKKTIDNAKDAARAAVDVLGVVAEATENVPYLGAISKALTAFKEVLDEVDVCKEDCRATMADANEFKDLIQKFQAKWDDLERGGDDELWEALNDLSRALLDCLETLQALKVDSKRRRDRFKLLFKRDEVQASVGKCRERMRVAKEKFNTTVAFDTNYMVRALHQRSQPQDVSYGMVPGSQATWQLRAANAIFYGRESEVEAAVDLIVSQAPARVAILGPGGIGKTSIALTVLHDPKVEEIYGDLRCFMSCEATTTADAVVRALADAIGFSIEKGISSENSRHRLISHLKPISGIICLDNLETPLDADKNNTEEFLNEISALHHVALLVTSRDTSIPAMKWSSPPLPHIQPFSQDAALATWDDICHGHDECALQLVKAVDCMPLAVTLLARLTSVEGSAKSIWARWETERTDLIRTGRDEHRLLNVGASIELSLRSLSHSEEAVTVIAMICIFPGGLQEDEISMLHDALKDRLSVKRAVTLLRQLSLVYTGERDAIRMLSPIRHYIQQHYISDDIFLVLVKAMMQQQENWQYHDWNVIVTFGWNRPGCRERLLPLVILFPRVTGNIEVLSQAIEKARKIEPQIQSKLLLKLRRQLSKLHQHLAHALNEVPEYEKARSSLSQAIEIDEQLGDRQALFEDWKECIWTFRHEFYGREDEFQHLDEVQNAIQKALELGRDESGVWDQDFGDYWGLAEAQHFVNEGRRKLHMPVVHRSGLFSDNDSTVYLGYADLKPAYDQLVATSSPPWDLSLILETIEKMHGASEETASSEDHAVSFKGSGNPE